MVNVNKLNEPAFPALENSTSGFTKLEIAALMIAGHLAASITIEAERYSDLVTDTSILLAKRILEECNK